MDTGRVTGRRRRGGADAAPLAPAVLPGDDALEAKCELDEGPGELLGVKMRAVTSACVKSANSQVGAYSPRYIYAGQCSRAVLPVKGGY